MDPAVQPPVEQLTTEPTQSKDVEVETATKHLTHGYESDLANSMNATDARVVQELLTDAREREVIDAEEKTIKRKHTWFVIGSFILLFIALGAAAYGVYHYMNLTVPAVKSETVGVFATTTPIVTNTTDIRQMFKTLKEDRALPERKPLLIPLVKDAQSLALISNNEIFTFIEAKPTEPFAAALGVLRLGVYNNGTEILPFLIAAIPDPEVASKEFLIEEPEMLKLFYHALSIDLSAHATEVGKGFESKYMYNLPVRTLDAIDTETGDRKTVLLYGYATENIIVITEKPEVLKAIYENVIRQQ